MMVGVLGWDYNKFMNGSSKWHPPIGKKRKKKKSWLLQVEAKMVHGQPMGKPN
jgi:hypothetical protein